MNMRFQVDPVYGLEITRVPPPELQATGVNPLVWIMITRDPLPPTVDSPPPPTEVAAYFGLKASEARTIASALMTMAQNIR